MMNMMTVNNNIQLQLPFTACLYVKLYVKIFSKLFLFNPPLPPYRSRVFKNTYFIGILDEEIEAQGS